MGKLVWDCSLKATNYKIIVACNFVHRLQAYAFLGAEYRTQWDMMKATNRAENLFKTENAVAAIAAQIITRMW